MTTNTSNQNTENPESIEANDKGERLLTKEYTRYTIEHLHRYALAASICAGKTIVDIASGEGYGSNIISKDAKKVTGIDISEEAVKHATNKYGKPNLKFKVGSATCIPIDPHSIDIVVSFETIEHLYEQETMLSEIKRILKPDGILLISTPDKRYFGGNEFHVKELDLDEFKLLIQKNFTKSRFYLQNTLYGSFICPNSTDEHLTTTPQLFFQGDYNKITKSNELVNPEYNLCIAGEKDIAGIPTGVFDGKKVYDSLTRELKKQQHHTENLEAQLINATNTLNDINSSLSFKLGRLITFPLRKLTGQL